ncbi:MAG: hypothetical protein AABX35_02495 [Nanoarchaeota archaeon]
MEARKIYYTSAGIIALVFITKIVLDIWKGTLLNSVSDFCALIFLILAFVLERDKIKNKKQNSFLVTGSYLVIIWFIINIFITFSSILILNEFAKENAIYQNTNISAIFMMILAGTSNFSGFLFIPIIINFIGIHIHKYHRHEIKPHRNLRHWLKGGFIGIAVLIALVIVPSLFDTSCEESNFLQSWGGGGCDSFREYVSVHISNFISTFFFAITIGLPMTIVLMLIFFGIGAGIGHWIDDKR